MSGLMLWILEPCIRMKPAKQMRKVIKIQLGIMDEEFRGKDIPDFDVVEDEE